MSPAPLDSGTGPFYSLSDRTRFEAKSCISGWETTKPKATDSTVLISHEVRAALGRRRQHLTDALNLVTLRNSQGEKLEAVA